MQYGACAAGRVWIVFETIGVRPRELVVVRTVVFLEVDPISGDFMFWSYGENCRMSTKMHMM